jgi:hypothetical protein
MPASAGNYPGHQPGTTQTRNVTGQGPLPRARKGPNFVSVIRLQLTAGAERCTQTPVSTWPAVIRPDPTPSDETGMRCPENRFRSLAVQAVSL